MQFQHLHAFVPLIQRGVLLQFAQSHLVVPDTALAQLDESGLCHLDLSELRALDPAWGTGYLHSGNKSTSREHVVGVALHEV